MFTQTKYNLNFYDIRVFTKSPFRLDMCTYSYGLHFWLYEPTGRVAGSAQHPVCGCKVHLFEFLVHTELLKTFFRALHFVFFLMFIIIYCPQTWTCGTILRATISICSIFLLSIRPVTRARRAPNLRAARVFQTRKFKNFGARAARASRKLQ